MSRYWLPLILKTVHLPTPSVLEKVFRKSARFLHEAFFVIRNHTSRCPSRSPCRSTASLSFLRLMTCMPLLVGSQYANIVLRKMRRCQISFIVCSERKYLAADS